MFARILIGVCGAAAGFAIAILLTIATNDRDKSVDRAEKRAVDAEQNAGETAGKLSQTRSALAKAQADLNKALDEKADLEAEIEQLGRQKADIEEALWSAQKTVEVDNKLIRSLRSLPPEKRDPIYFDGGVALIREAFELDGDFESRTLASGETEWDYTAGWFRLSGVGERERWRSAFVIFESCQSIDELRPRVEAVQRMVEAFGRGSSFNEINIWVLKAMAAVQQAPEGATVQQTIGRADAKMSMLLGSFCLSIVPHRPEK